MKSKRVFDVVASGIGLILLIPIFTLLAIVIKLDSRGPVFFRQKRIGQNLRPFYIHKFRTMTQSRKEVGLQITVGDDARITNVGKFLRKYKLDELAQLIDVFRGKMSIVGPRPEVPAYVEFYPVDAKKRIFSLKPGITDLASIEYKDENLILAMSDDPHRDYIEKIIPVKVEYYLDYCKTRTMLGDLKIIFLTLRALIR